MARPLLAPALDAAAPVALLRPRAAASGALGGAGAAGPLLRPRALLGAARAVLGTPLLAGVGARLLARRRRGGAGRRAVVEDDLHTQAVRRWVDEFVVGHNFCPWAGPALAVGGVRVVASDARSAEGVLVDLRAEAEALPPGGSAPCEGQAVTTLLACPHVAEWGSPSAFQAFYDTVLASGYVFASLELYIVSFHPRSGDAGARPQLAAGDRLQLGEGPSGVPVLATVLDPSAGFGEGGQRLARVQVDGRGETFICLPPEPAGGGAGGAASFLSRAPRPVLHLLRVDDLDRAEDRDLQRRNRQRAEELGAEALQALQERCG